MNLVNSSGNVVLLLMTLAQSKKISNINSQGSQVARLWAPSPSLFSYFYFFLILLVPLLWNYSLRVVMTGFDPLSLTRSNPWELLHEDPKPKIQVPWSPHSPGRGKPTVEPTMPLISTVLKCSGHCKLQDGWRPKEIAQKDKPADLKLICILRTEYLKNEFPVSFFNLGQQTKIQTLEDRNEVLKIEPRLPRCQAKCFPCYMITLVPLYEQNMEM